MYYIKIELNTFPKFIMAHKFITDRYYSSGHRSFDLFELVFVEEGEWTMTVDDYCEFTAYSGDMFISPPALPHMCCTQPKNKPYIANSIVILANFKYEILNENDLMNFKKVYFPVDENEFLIIPFHFIPEKSLHMKEKFNSLIKEFNVRDFNSAMAMCGLYLSLVSDISRICLNSLESENCVYTPASNYLYTKKVIEYLYNNYEHRMDFNALSEYVNLHRNYMCNLFKKTMNVTITDYLNKIRIEKAKELLYTTDCAINIICRKVGMENEQYFGRLFKKLEGISPKQYRLLKF